VRASENVDALGPLDAAWGFHDDEVVHLGSERQRGRDVAGELAVDIDLGRFRFEDFNRAECRSGWQCLRLSLVSIIVVSRERSDLGST
jgi:hypothetical protein